MTDLTDEAVKALLGRFENPASRADANKAIETVVLNFPSFARALLDARAELARLRADAQAAVALMVERAATQADPWDGPVTKNKIVDAQAIAAQQIKARIRALAPADGLAAVDALRVEARENAMQALASMGQAQEAYEAQLEAEAELAAAQQREAALSDPICVHVNMLRGTIAKPTLDQIVHLYGVDALCKALMPVIVREAEAAIIRKGGTL